MAARIEQRIDALERSAGRFGGELVTLIVRGVPASGDKRPVSELREYSGRCWRRDDDEVEQAFIARVTAAASRPFGVALLVAG